MWHMHIIEYYLATKGAEVLIHDIPSMNLENMLKEVRHEDHILYGSISTKCQD